jgi:hypothetical protein
MILTAENRNTRRKPCPSETLPTTNPTSTGLGSNPGTRRKRRVTDLVKHGMTLHLKYVQVRSSELRHNFCSYVQTEVKVESRGVELRFHLNLCTRLN